jgi:hypothetical protein
MLPSLTNHIAEKGEKVSFVPSLEHKALRPIYISQKNTWFTERRVANTSGSDKLHTLWTARESASTVPWISRALKTLDESHKKQNNNLHHKVGQKPRKTFGKGKQSVTTVESRWTNLTFSRLELATPPALLLTWRSQTHCTTRKIGMLCLTETEWGCLRWSTLSFGYIWVCLYGNSCGSLALVEFVSVSGSMIAMSGCF